MRFGDRSEKYGWMPRRLDFYVQKLRIDYAAKTITLTLSFVRKDLTTP
jgi:hypothetical protein